MVRTSRTRKHFDYDRLQGQARPNNEEIRESCGSSILWGFVFSSQSVKMYSFIVWLIL